MNIGSSIDPRERESNNYRTRSQRWRTEYEWEQWFIKTLKKLGWTFRGDLLEEGKTKEYLLKSNLLKQLERFFSRRYDQPSFRFTSDEKEQLLNNLFAGGGQEVEESIELFTKTRALRVPSIDRKNIENNCFEVVQQVEEYRRGRYKHIYDLVLLINGIPLVFIELKKATISNDEGFEQLKRYERDRIKFDPLSIFNNFQLFIATNFQRVACFYKRDIRDLGNLQYLTIDLCDRDFFPQLNHINYYFSPSRILEKIFESDTRFSRHINNWRTMFFEPAERIVWLPPIWKENYSSFALKGGRWLKFKNLLFTRKFSVAKAIYWSLLIEFFLLINFLSRWQWWTILIGALILLFGYIKRLRMYLRITKMVKFIDTRYLRD